MVYVAAGEQARAVRAHRLDQPTVRPRDTKLIDEIEAGALNETGEDLGPTWSPGTRALPLPSGPDCMRALQLLRGRGFERLYLSSLTVGAGPPSGAALRMSW